MRIIQIKNRLCTAFRVLFAAVFLSAASFIDARRLLVAPTEFFYQEPLSIDMDRTPLGSFNSVAFLQDSNKQMFIIKCYANAEQAIHEALGAYVGASVGIHINKVKIIPPHMCCVGKSNNCTATIHTCVPGIEVQNIDTMSNKLNVYGGLKCAANLQSLVEHDDLCPIVALDIFLDNCDRHNGNLFFDEKTGYFYAIDMDRIFGAVLCVSNDTSDNEWSFADGLAADAYQFLVTLNKEQLSSEEKRALSHVCDWLNKLLDKYSRAALYHLWMNLAQEAMYTYSFAKKKCIQEIIDYHFSQVQLVVTQLNCLAVA